MTAPRPRTRATSARLRPSATADRTVCGLLRAAVCTAGSTSGRGTTARIAGDTAAAAAAVSDVAAARHCRPRRLRESRQDSRWVNNNYNFGGTCVASLCSAPAASEAAPSGPGLAGRWVGTVRVPANT